MKKNDEPVKKEKSVGKEVSVKNQVTDKQLSGKHSKQDLYAHERGRDAGW